MVGGALSGPGLVEAWVKVANSSAPSHVLKPRTRSPCPQPGGEFGHLDGCHLLLEYLDLVDLHPAPWRMVKGHAFQLLGALAGWCAAGWAAGLGSVLQVSDSPAALLQLLPELLALFAHHLFHSPAHPAPLSPPPPPPSPSPPPGPWLSEFTDLRDQLNRSHEWDTERLRGLVMDMLERIEATGRSEWLATGGSQAYAQYGNAQPRTNGVLAHALLSRPAFLAPLAHQPLLVCLNLCHAAHPVPALSARALARMEAEARLQQAIAEQEREEAAVAALEQGSDGDAAANAQQAAAAAEAEPQQQAALAGV